MNTILTVVLGADDGFAVSVDGAAPQDYDDGSLELGATVDPYSVSQKKSPPPYGFLKFFPNGWEFLINVLHTYYTIISTLDYKFLFKYLQL